MKVGWHKFITLTRESNRSPVIMRCDKISEITDVMKAKKRITEVIYDGRKVTVVEDKSSIKEMIRVAVPVRSGKRNMEDA